jgi:hypothetical protein
MRIPIRNHRKMIIGYQVFDTLIHLPVFALMRSLGEGTLKLFHLKRMVSQHVILQITQRAHVDLDIDNHALRTTGKAKEF